MQELVAKAKYFTTVLKGWNITMALGDETPSFTNMGLGFI